MRTQIFASTLLAFAFTAWGQQAAPPPMKTFVSSAEVKDAVAKAKAERKADQPLVAEPILSLAPYRAHWHRRHCTRKTPSSCMCSKAWATS
jgi:hypothetical protein